MWGKGTTITAVTVVTEGTEIRSTILWILNVIRKTETDSYASKDKSHVRSDLFSTVSLGKSLLSCSKIGKGLDWRNSGE